MNELHMIIIGISLLNIIGLLALSRIYAFFLRRKDSDCRILEWTPKQKQFQKKKRSGKALIEIIQNTLFYAVILAFTTSEFSDSIISITVLVSEFAFLYMYYDKKAPIFAITEKGILVAMEHHPADRHSYGYKKWSDIVEYKQVSGLEILVRGHNFEYILLLNGDVLDEVQKILYSKVHFSYSIEERMI